MAVVNFFGNPIAVTPAAKVSLGASAIQNGVVTVGSQNTNVGVGQSVVTIMGGPGSNTYWLGYNTSLVQGATTGIDTVISAGDYVMPSTITNLTMNGAFAGFGNSGANYIVGSLGSNLIDGGGGDDVLTGGSGTTYEFDAGQPGHTLITNFVPGAAADGGKTDDVRLVGYSQFATFAQVQAALTQVGSDVVLTLNSTTAIKFSDTQVSQFTAANFELALSPSSYGAASFTDNFSSLSLWNGSSGVWATNYGWGGNPNNPEARTLPGTGEKELYVDPSMTGTGKTALGLDPYSVSNGVLTIHAGPTPAGEAASIWGYNYTSGMISTRYTFTQTYGYFDAEMKLPSGQGNWPAFWLYAVNGSSELDVMEEQNGSNEITGTAHNDGSGTEATGVKDYIPNLTDGFHNFGVLWTPTTITWYVDGVSIGSVATPSNLNSPMYMIANLALNSSVPSNYAGGNLEIEYIHAYTLANSPVQPTSGSGSTTAASTTTASTTTASTTTASTTTASTTTQATTTASTTTPSTTTASTTTQATTTASTTTPSTTTASTTTAPATTVSTPTVSTAAASTAAAATTHAVTPTVTSMSAVINGTNAMLAAGETAKITLKISEAVTVVGTPTLQLSDGGVAKYVSGSGTNTLIFTYVGDTAQHTDLHVTGLVTPTGSSIKDAAGNALTTATGDLGVWISSYQPYNAGISATSSTGTSYAHAGSTVTFTMAATEAVNVTGKPSLTLSDGGVATYVGGSGTNTLTFSYVVQAGQTASALAVTGLSMGANGAIADANGNPWQGTVTAHTSIVVDTTAPTFLGVTSSASGSASLNTGQSATLTVHTSEAVDVTGKPMLQLSDGETATYVSGSGTSTLTFAYAPTASHVANDIQVTGLSLASGASITDLAGNAATGTVTGDLHMAVNMPGVQIAYGTGSHDVFVAQSSSEVFVEPTVNDGSAIVLSSYNFTLPSNVNVLHLEGSGNLTGTANSGTDTLYANGGSDTLIGGSGADTMVGSSGPVTMIAGTGNDTMQGGFGTDTFVFKPGAGHDVVSNFSGKDVIDISAFLAAGLTPHLSSAAAGEMISFTNGASIQLLGIQASQLVSTATGYIHG